ncbi:hypothetical protein GOP47_0015153 [Adiantum capillus-veneris]|nr:hypothetical protein GOP47_0015153 [Adiantum capillus-veneris]
MKIERTNNEHAKPPIRSKCRAIKAVLKTRHSDIFPANLTTFYDGSQTLYTTGRLQLHGPEQSFDVQLRDALNRNLQEDYRVTLKDSKQIDLEGRYAFVNGIIQTYDIPQDLVQALDVAMREAMTCSNVYFEHGKRFFRDNAGEYNETSYGKFWDGFYQTLKKTMQGLAVNVNKAVAAFYVDRCVAKNGSVINGAPTVANYIMSNTNFSEAETMSQLRGATVVVGVPQQSNGTRTFIKKTFKIETFAGRPRDVFFKLGDTDQEISVADHFEQTGRTIQFGDLPCVKLQSAPGKNVMVPSEYCLLLTPQHIRVSTEKAEQNAFSKGIILKASSAPHVTRATIQRLMTNQNNNQQPAGQPLLPRPGSTPQGFQMNVSADMTQVIAKLLDSPLLCSSRRADGLVPNDGTWNILETKVARAGRIDSWLIITFKPLREDETQCSEAINPFRQRLMTTCKNDLGIDILKEERFKRPLHYVDAGILDNYGELYQSLRAIITHSPNYGTTLVIFVFWAHSYSGYQFVKHICECTLGVITQCCKYDNIKNGASKPYLRNLALKINVKAGGTTSYLQGGAIAAGSRSRCIVMGADTSHAGKGEDPAVTAVVASLASPALNGNFQKYAARIRLQAPRVELIQDFRVMAQELLGPLRSSLGVRDFQATRVIMFRDGVSEGQFEDMLTQEVESLRAALADVFGTATRPRITWVVVQKRHNTKLFTDDPNLRMNSNDPNRRSQLKPGLMVDEKITHPADFDFYLCSHPAPKGTGKPTHYHVLYDENGFGALELPTLVNRLCYTYARCASAVSIPAPTFYAHLAAYRGHQLYTALRKKGELSNLNFQPDQLPATYDLSGQLTAGIKDTMFFC